MPCFPNSVVPITNYINGKEYRLQRVDEISNSQDQLERITSICNEPLVFQTLFAEMFPDGVYPLSSARSWLSWGADGWDNRTHFVFAVVDTNGLVVAACDIKSNELEGAEIGYWSSCKHSGVMTDSVIGMLDMAGKAGFKRFYAEVSQDNLKSESVLRRIGFIESDVSCEREGHKVYKSQ